MVWVCRLVPLYLFGFDTTKEMERRLLKVSEKGKGWWSRFLPSDIIFIVNTWCIDKHTTTHISTYTIRSFFYLVFLVLYCFFFPLSDLYQLSSLYQI